MQCDTDQELLSLIHATTPGRARFYDPRLYRSEEAANWIKMRLGQSEGIVRVATNALTGTILVHFQSKRKTLGEIQNTLAQLLSLWAARPFRWEGRRDAVAGKPWHCMKVEDVAAETASSSVSGLHPQDVKKNERKYGYNSTTRIATRSKLSIFSHQFQNLPSKLLIGSAVLSVATGSMSDAIIIGAVLLINGYIGYSMESSSEKIISSLIQPDQRKIRVIRSGKTTEMDATEMVVGDLFLLGPGMTVPTDSRLIRAEGLSIDESLLTGESYPSSKSIDPIPDENLPIADRKNIVFRGTVVSGGSGLALATAVGNSSEIGRIQQLMTMHGHPLTQLEKQLARLGEFMATTAISASCFVLLVSIARGQRFLDALKGVVSMTVAAIPESLPTVATTTLAVGLRKLKERDVIVRNMGAMETMAAVDHICLDKTGTLTTNQMEVTLIRTMSGPIELTSAGLFRQGHSLDVHKSPTLLNLAKVAALCNDAELEFYKSPKKVEVNGSSTEGALLRMALKMGMSPEAIRFDYPLVSTRYRTEKSQYMQTVHSGGRGGNFVGIKGSPSDVLALCSTYQQGHETHRFTKELKEKILRENEEMASRGLRVLGFAYGKIKLNPVWLGLVGMVDPIREGIAEVIPLFRKSGIAASMITGDQASTARAIGNTLGIKNIYSRVSPGKKFDIIRKLQDSDRNIVAMIGDGINDGPALKSANVGIAMAARGAEVASQVADIVLPNDNISELIGAVEEGRVIHRQMKKATDYAVSKNLSEIVFAVFSILFWRTSPLSPLQFLWINLITDTVPELALAQEVPDGDVLRDPPRSYRNDLISKKDLKKIAFDAGVLSIAPTVNYYLGMRRYGNPAKASSLAFLTMAGSSLFYTLNSRSDQLTLFEYGKLKRNPYISIAVLGGFLTQVAGLIFRPISALLGVQNLTSFDLLVSTAGSVIPLFAIEARKTKQPENRRIWNGTF